MFWHILVPTDGSAGAELAVQSSIRFAKSIGARVTGLHVVASSDEASPAAEVDPCLLVIQHSARQASVPCDVAIARSDDVSHAIFQAAYDRQCDLIAIASHGHKDARDLKLGHDTQEVLAEMGNVQIRRVPVIDQASHSLVGIVSLGDMATKQSEGIEQALEEISSPSEPDRTGKVS